MVFQRALGESIPELIESRTKLSPKEVPMNRIAPTCEFFHIVTNRMLPVTNSI